MSTPRTDAFVADLLKDCLPGLSQVEYALMNHARQLETELAEALAALRELHAMVNGECPSLLDDDSGGSGRLGIEIEDILAKHKEPR